MIVVMIGLLVSAFLAWLRRRKNQRNPRTGAPRAPPAPPAPPVVREDVRLPADIDYYQDITKSSTVDSKSGESTLWEDPVIVAARISIDRIKLGALIGRGGFGEVYRGRYRDQNVAIKRLTPEKRKDLTHVEAFLSEVRLMAIMEHPNIVQFVGVAWESLSDLYCVTEFMAGGDLRDLLNDCSARGAPRGMDANKVEIAYQVAYALTYLHSLEPTVLHRDFKSRNILLTKALDAKVTDFGASRVRSNETMTAGVGSWMWMAPEVMMGEHYDEKADVFSLGVVVSELDTHELPYSHAKEDGLPDAAMMQRIILGMLRVQFSQFMDRSMVFFIETCLSLDPQERPTAAEALYYFQKAKTR